VAVRELVIEDKIFRQLGEDGLSDLSACLWAVDCQTCGRFLGDDPPSLWVNDSIVFAVASLHHPGCQAPGWNDSGLIVGLPFSAEYVSFITVMLLVPKASRCGTRARQSPVSGVCRRRDAGAGRPRGRRSA